jgi:hypothetical protein
MRQPFKPGKPQLSTGPDKGPRKPTFTDSDIPTDRRGKALLVARRWAKLEELMIRI